jgi:hypothetical protein
LQLGHVPLLQLLHRLEGCCFVVRHVLVPRVIELLELKFLSAFNSG